MHKFMQKLASAYKFGERPFLVIFKAQFMMCSSVFTAYSCMNVKIFNLKSLKVS